MNHFLKIVISVVVIISIFSCKKDAPLTPPDNVQTDTLVWKTITGALVLPAGVSGTGIRVNSGRSDSAVLGGQYVAEVLQDDFGIQIVRNAAGNEILMGYTYPGQTDFSINAKSTITAIMMMLPDVQWLNQQGKLSFLENIHNSPKLDAAVSQLESDLAGGGLLYDTSHVEFMNRISELYGEAAGHKISSGPESVKFSRVNKQVMIENAGGKPFSHCIGVYKDGQSFMPSFTLDRYKFFASSYSELITRAEGSIPDEVSGKIISLGGDGKYEFRIRTGRPFSGVNGFESQQAFVENGTNFVMDNLAPTLKVLNLNNKCLGAIRSSSINSFQNIKAVVLQNNQGSWQLFKKMVLATAASSAEIAKSAIDCQKTAAPLPNTYQALFAASIKKFYNWFDNVALVLNNGNLMIQYFYYPAAQDTCLMVSGNAVTPCNTCPATVTDIDGNVYNTVIIGEQCWMKENLKTNKFRDGSSITTGLSDTAWKKTSSGAYSIYEDNLANNDIYGKLYNWYALTDSRNLCPTGWHVPSDAEWTNLENHLGGASLAGGKMKTTIGWQPTNIDATNSSGFSGLPGGFRGDEGTFDFIGTGGDWWSSSQSSSSSTAWGRHLGFYDGVSYRDFYPKTLGFSVRCLRD